MANGTATGASRVIPATHDGKAVIEIAEYGFLNLVDITSITLPSSLVTISTGALYGTRATTLVIPSGVTVIGENSLSQNPNLTAVSLPSGLLTIGNSAFQENTSLASVSLPSSLTSLGDAAFYKCPITSISIPIGVTSIGATTFRQTALTSITLHSGITSIGAHAFRDSANFASITINRTSPPTLGTSALSNVSASLKIYVPSEAVDAYKAASGWSGYSAVIEAIPSTPVTLTSVNYDNYIAPSGYEDFTIVNTQADWDALVTASFSGVIDLLINCNIEISAKVTIPNTVKQIIALMKYTITAAGSSTDYVLDFASGNTCTVTGIAFINGINTRKTLNNPYRVEDCTFTAYNPLSVIENSEFISKVDISSIGAWGTSAIKDCKNISDFNIAAGMGLGAIFVNCFEIYSGFASTGSTTGGGQAFSGCGDISGITLDTVDVCFYNCDVIGKVMATNYNTLYSNCTNIATNKLDKVTSAVENNLVTFDDDGTVKDSGISIDDIGGTETFSALDHSRINDSKNFKMRLRITTTMTHALPFSSSATNSVLDIYWGDGSSDLSYSTTSGSLSHTYDVAGTYTIVVVYVSGSGGLNFGHFGSQYVDDSMILSLEFPSTGSLSGTTNFLGYARRLVALVEVLNCNIPYNGDSNRYTFENCTALKRFTGSGYIRTDCFSGCTALEYVEFTDALNVSDRAFYNCTALKTLKITSNGYGGYSDGSSNCFGNVALERCIFSGSRASELYALVTATNGTYPATNNITIFGTGGIPLDSGKSLSDVGLKYSYTAALPYASWTGSAAPYTKSVTVTGILSVDNPEIRIDFSELDDDYEDEMIARSNLANIYKVVTSSNTLTFYADAVPTADIPLIISGVR